MSYVDFFIKFFLVVDGYKLLESSQFSGAGVVGYQSQVEVVLAHLSFRLSGPIQSAAQLGNQATPPGRLLG